MTARAIIDSALCEFNATYNDRSAGGIKANWDDCDSDCRTFWMFVWCQSMQVSGRVLHHASTPLYIVTKAKHELRRGLIKAGADSRYNVYWEVLRRPRKVVHHVYDRDTWHIRVSFYGGPDGVTISELLGKR